MGIRLNQAQKDEVRTLAQEGRTQREIREKTGLSMSTIVRYSRPDPKVRLRRKKTPYFTQELTPADVPDHGRMVAPEGVLVMIVRGATPAFLREVLS